MKAASLVFFAHAHLRKDDLRAQVKSHLLATPAHILNETAAQAVIDPTDISILNWDGFEESSASGKRKWSGSANGNYNLLSPLEMGMFNTGTNLFTLLMYNNFKGEKRVTTPIRPRYWKHMQPSQLHALNPIQGSQEHKANVTRVAMIRNPLSWLISIKKEPYDLQGCGRGPNWLDSSCVLPARESQTPSDTHYSSLPDVWNTYTREYDDLQSYGFYGATVVRYEALVLSTLGEIQKVARLAGLREPTTLTQIYSPAKAHGDAVGRDAAIEKIEGKTYLQQYTSDELETACRLLDKDLMSKHGYNDCDGH